ncbi:hypothetical protein SFRURICE_017778, partial [Spodoptera frugiperda]
DHFFLPLGCFSTRDVLCYVAVDAFGFYQSYSLMLQPHHSPPEPAPKTPAASIANTHVNSHRTKTAWCFKESLHRPASHSLHATDFSLSCIETRTTASADPHRTDRIISNAYMRCVRMTSYGMRTMRAIRTMRACERLPLVSKFNMNILTEILGN